MSEKSHNWIVPYGNLMTILMIFFLLLYAFTYLTGRVDYEKVVASIAKGFGREIPYKEVELAEYLEDYFSRKQLLEGFKLEPDRIKLIFSIPLFFETGSTKLKPQAVEILNDIFPFSFPLSSVHYPLFQQSKLCNYILAIYIARYNYPP